MNKDGYQEFMEYYVKTLQSFEHDPFVYSAIELAGNRITQKYLAGKIKTFQRMKNELDFELKKAKIRKLMRDNKLTYPPTKRLMIEIFRSSIMEWLKVTPELVRQSIRHAVDGRYPQIYYKCFELRYADKKSLKEIKELTGYSVGHISRMIRTLLNDFQFTERIKDYYERNK